MGNDKLRGELWDFFDNYINKHMPKTPGEKVK